MYNFTGGYFVTKLRDGTDGNYTVASDYFRDLLRLRDENLAAFNQIAHVVHGYAKDLPLFVVPTEDYKRQDFLDLAKLATIKTLGSALKCRFGRAVTPDFVLVSPFKHPKSPDLPTMVDSKHIRDVCLDWSGHVTELWPAVRLRR